MIFWKVIFQADHSSLFRSTTLDKNILCGVSQGLVLGRIIFNIYDNDVVYASKIFKFVLFIDDNNIWMCREHCGYITE